MKIPFNKPYIAKNELQYVRDSIESGLISGDRRYTQKVQQSLESNFNLGSVLLTTSCSTALDMSAMLLNLKEGDEVILPSYTFVSTANAIVMQNANPIFVDIDDSLNIDITKIEEKITKKTKAIYPVHYAGCSCDMDKLQEIADRYNLKVVEDGAQAVDAKYKNKYLGSLGCMATYSFHETKNFVCGEGGALILNDKSFLDRAEILREKGTNRSKFFKGFVDKYTWCDKGGSYLPADILAAMLTAQIEVKDTITKKRGIAFNAYLQQLKDLESSNKLQCIKIPKYNTPNYHIFYIIVDTPKIRDSLLLYLKENGIGAVFHYIPLHLSPMGVKYGYKEGDFPISESKSMCLIRLPMFADISEEEISYISDKIHNFFKNH